MLSSARTLVTRSAVRRLTTATPMPAGAVPQLFLKSHGAHRAGLIKDISTVVAAHGASIASTGKIVLGDEYAMMMYLWAPAEDKMASMKAELEATLKAGADEVSIKVLDAEARASYAAKAAVSSEERRLQVECSQKPGIILAITELLSAQGCKIPKMETATFVKEGVVHFKMDAVVHVTGGNADSIAQQLDGVLAANPGLELTFDDSQGHRVNVMEHA